MLARLRAHLRDEVRNRAGRAAMDWLKRLSDLTRFPAQARPDSEPPQIDPTRFSAQAQSQSEFPHPGTASHRTASNFKKTCGYYSSTTS
ncbi:hypothetical protein CKF42_07475 [Pantoea sp. ARC270]|nr:hypothetical protein CKF42_07475 [Pantoea sp. ARC270]